jgi:hypothetical protein
MPLPAVAIKKVRGRECRVSLLTARIVALAKIQLSVEGEGKGEQFEQSSRPMTPPDAGPGSAHGLRKAPIRGQMDFADSYAPMEPAPRALLREFLTPPGRPPVQWLDQRLVR